MGLIYDTLESYPKYERDFKRFKKVTIFRTKYSIKIDYGKRKVFLNNEEQGKTNILGLINRVKNDVDNYILKVNYKGAKDNNIYWSYYNDESEVINEGFEVAKIDLTAAYWTKAINLGIISKKTVDYFDTLKFATIKEKKSARLKALGSLATMKRKEVVYYGKKSHEFYPIEFVENYRSVYMGICNDVAKDMQTVLGYTDGIFYYWDCIFVKPEYMEKVVELFKGLGYKCTVEKHKAHIFKSKKISYLSCPNKKGKDIQYFFDN